MLFVHNLRFWVFLIKKLEFKIIIIIFEMKKLENSDYFYFIFQKKKRITEPAVLERVGSFSEKEETINHPIITCVIN